jgi:RNA polymerase sigma-70 factor (TIGR02960 family)
MSTELLTRAQAGDEASFGELIAPYRQELHVHCYRILGSLQDAEDAVQETVLAAWRGLGGFEQRASFRTWVYTIATSRCMNMLRAASRRPRRTDAGLPFDPPEPSTATEPVWLEPYPDVLLSDAPPDPQARYEAKEAISLAFMTALQLLPPRQRAVLILRDVLAFRAAEVARMLETSEESVTSALKRARATLDQRMPRQEPAPEPNSAAERDLVERLTTAFAVSDVDGIVALLSDDVRLAMPPLPLEYHGLGQAQMFLTHIAALHHERQIIQTRANGQPALALYAHDGAADIDRALGLLVVTLSGDRVNALTRFEPSVFPHFGLPRTLPHSAV